jgi:hypothetical protein
VEGGYPPGLNDQKQRRCRRQENADGLRGQDRRLKNTRHLYIGKEEVDCFLTDDVHRVVGGRGLQNIKPRIF